VKTDVNLPSARLAHIQVSVNLTNVEKAPVEVTLEGEIADIDNTSEDSPNASCSASGSTHPVTQTAPGEVPPGAMGPSSSPPAIC
jgi:hypothetical protein